MNEQLSGEMTNLDTIPSLGASLDVLDEAELDFDTAWTRFMDEQQHMSSPEPTEAVTAVPPSPKVLSHSEHRRLLDARESDAFARFLDTLMLEPSSLGKSARKLEEELHILTSKPADLPLPTNAEAKNDRFLFKKTSSEPEIPSDDHSSPNNETMTTLTPSPSSMRNSPRKSPSKNPEPRSSQPKLVAADPRARQHASEYSYPSPYPVYTPPLVPGVGYYPSILPGSVFPGELPPSEQHKLFNQGYEQGYSIGFARAFDMIRSSSRPLNFPFPNGSPPLYPPLIDCSQVMTAPHSVKPDCFATNPSAPSAQSSPYQSSSRNSPQSELMDDKTTSESEISSSKRRRTEGSISRLNHTQSEKRRRFVIKSLFEELGSLVPKIRESRGTISKTVSLDYTFDYIVEMRKKNDQLRFQLAEQGTSLDTVRKVAINTSHL